MGDGYVQTGQIQPDAEPAGFSALTSEPNLDLAKIITPAIFFLGF